MPFDPTEPQPDTPLDADQMRAQLNGLNDIINALPCPPGSPVPASVAELSAAISGTADSVNDLTPLSITISDPPTQAEVQAIVNWCNALFAGLVRT